MRQLSELEPLDHSQTPEQADNLARYDELSRKFNRAAFDAVDPVGSLIDYRFVTGDGPLLHMKNGEWVYAQH